VVAAIVVVVPLVALQQRTAQAIEKGGRAWTHHKASVVAGLYGRIRSLSVPERYKVEALDALGRAARRMPNSDGQAALASGGPGDGWLWALGDHGSRSVSVYGALSNWVGHQRLRYALERRYQRGERPRRQMVSIEVRPLGDGNAMERQAFQSDDIEGPSRYRGRKSFRRYYLVDGQGRRVRRMSKDEAWHQEVRLMNPPP
jgi:hypothetical protein